jgi:putative alpha-1,2-mannosidase
VHPASGVYDLGVPDQEFARVRLGGSGKTLTVRAVPFDPAKPYVRQVSFNGRPIPSLQIAHAEIMAGGELVFEMSDRPAPIAPSETGVRSAGGGAIPGTVVNPGKGLAP